MNQLPAIPQPSAFVRIEDVITMESRVAQAIAHVDDIESLQEWHAQAEALERYLRGKELNGPMLGAQRRIEARIGQLLGETSNGERHDLKPSHVSEGCISRMDRNRFRLLARGFDVLRDQDWRQSRTALLKFLHERFPVPKKQPEPYVQKDGKVKKPRAERAAEISELAAKGWLAAQIATEIGMGEGAVKDIARAEGITLPEAAMGRTTGRIRADRVVEETVMGVESYADGLKFIEGAPLTEISEEDARAWASSLSRSIRTISRLRKRLLEITNGKSTREEPTGEIEGRADIGSPAGEDEGVRSGTAGAEAA